MSAALASLIVLAAMFIVATIFPINMGALAFVGAFLLGTVVLGMQTDDILTAFPGDLFLTLVGVTYLFAIAQNNGTIDILVNRAVKLVDNRISLIPWVMFAITAGITAVGALGPAAVAIIAPIGLSFAARYKINPLMMGMLIVHGAQAGGFSPIAVYGVIVNGLIAKTGFDFSPIALFLSSLVFNLVIAVILFLVLGGRQLGGQRAGQIAEKVAESRLAVSAGAHGADVNFKSTGSGTYGPRDPASDGTASPVEPGRKFGQWMTILGLVALVIFALGFKVDVGFVSITIAVILALLNPSAQKGAVNKISWSTVLLICGMLTFVGVLEEAGTIDWASESVSNLGMPLIAALVICYIGAIVSAFASSTAILAALIPLAIPFLNSGEVSAVGVVCALAVSSTIVDVSPFSTNGALVLANAPDDTDMDRFYKQILAYGGIVVAVGPLLAWLTMVLPGFF
ncbi:MULTISPECIES: SLC13 family permease [unclassified Brevibacterium]|uniref:SLC13 family permease n=1 Tax=unclassified Brevibacterium TaxID=2614124 RepID=UPI001091B349|nr:SLC13 family permease [Brevibacterium sp. S22]TGD29793.1 hypothetical protein EB835_15525 [Brevibacterium sp. S22]